jgi:predicted molibdopterin-dependent oxidoreductase YjgC
MLARLSCSRLQFLVVQDRFLTETAKLAHVVLPSASFAEKDGTWTSVERRVQRVRQALKPIGESRPDWAILTDLMRRMGIRASYAGPNDVLREINDTVPIYRGITIEHLELEDVFWPCSDPENPGTPILYAHTPSKGFVDKTLKIPDLSAPKFQKEYPFWLIVNESLFHSRDRAATAKTSLLQAASLQYQVVMNPCDANSANIKDGDLVVISSSVGSIQSRVSLVEQTPRGTLLATNSSSFTFSRLFAMADRDPLSGTPRLNRTAVKVEVVHEHE